jgi:hypothetical protein
VRLYFNQSGNSWGSPQPLRVFPRLDELVSVTPIDLVGSGNACLVWSSPLPRDAQQPMRYVNLMGGQKPHLLVKTVNNLGAETVVQYAPSTRFYLQDKLDGKPWITKLPFPVHVVERVETYDHVSRNRFVTRYAYHHGYFDGQEREFRGFGLVEQFNSEEFVALTADGTLPAAANLDAASHMPRQEVYALDGTAEAKHPYTVTEQNFTIRRLQPQGENRHAVFFPHAREAISYHYWEALRELVTALVPLDQHEPPLANTIPSRASLGLIPLLSQPTLICPVHRGTQWHKVRRCSHHERRLAPRRLSYILSSEIDLRLKGN